MRNILFLLVLLYPFIADATVTVNQSYTNIPTQVCTPSDSNSNCGGGSSSSYWTLSGSNLYPTSTSDTVTVGSSTTSLDTFTVQTGSFTGGITNNFSPSGVGGNDSNTEYLAPLNNSAVDISQNAFTITNSNVTFSNSSPKLSGTYYGLFNGSNTVLTSPTSSTLNFGTGDFTLDLDAYFISNSVTYGMLDYGATTTGWGLYYVSTHTLRLTIANSDIALAWTPTINTWYHIAVQRKSGAVTMYINGVGTSVGSKAGSVTFASTLKVGNYAGSNYFNGQIQEVRVSNIARYSGNFTPPISPYDGLSNVGLPSYNLFINGVLAGFTKVNGNDSNNLELGTTSTQVSIETSGNTGIGTKTPVALLEVNGTGQFDSTLTFPSPFTLGSTSVTTTGTQFNYLNAATGTTGTTSTNLVFSASPTEATPTFTTNATVPLVIGSASANGTLTIEGNSASSANTSTNANLTFNVGNSGGTTAMTILNNGNVGIGVTGPAGALDVNGTIFSRQTTVPACSSCGTCSVTGSDNGFRVTVGTTTSCTASFNGSYSHTPACVCMQEGTSSFPNCSVSSSAVTCSTVVTGDAMDCTCFFN